MSLDIYGDDYDNWKLDTPSHYDEDLACEKCEKQYKDSEGWNYDLCNECYKEAMTCDHCQNEMDTEAFKDSNEVCTRCNLQHQIEIHNKYYKENKK